MAVLIQEVICGDYAFVIHTKNPLSGDTTEIYAEVCILLSLFVNKSRKKENMFLHVFLAQKQIVKGLGESLVGAYPGRAMSFIVKKSNLKSPTVMSNFSYSHLLNYAPLSCTNTQLL